MLGGIGLPELIVIFLVILLLFGSKALPEVAKGLAQAIKTFKNEVQGVKESISEESVDKMSSEQESSEIVKDTSNDFKSDDINREWRPKVDA